LINASPKEVAFVKNAGEGISIVARGTEWQWGDRIVTSNVGYPANIYPWMEVSRYHGAQLVLVPEQTDDEETRRVPTESILAAAEQKQTKIVSISHVEYASGQRHDLAKIGEFCRSRGILFCVDAIQSLGAIPIDVKAMKIDFLSADGHKWLLGPEGAGIFYCRQELIERTRPLMIGWMDVKNGPEPGEYDYELRPDAVRFECGSHNFAGLLGLKASMSLLAKVRTEHIFDRLKVLTDRLIDGIVPKGYHIVSPRAFGQWSGSVAFTSPEHPSEEVFKKLRKDHKIELAIREGRMRCSPHFYNTQQQIDQLIEALP
jgi:selenocysteine lyase/cysteine desulfurase